MLAPLQVAFVESPHAKAAVARLVRKVYFETYGTHPPDACAYGAVYRNGEPVACLGLDYAEPDGRFAVERIFSLDRATLPVPLCSASAVQLGRLVSLERGLGILAVYTGIWFAHVRGFRYGILEHNATIHQIALGFGLVFLPIETWSINLAEVTPGDRPYYEKREGVPYLLDLRGSLEGMRSRMPAAWTSLFSKACDSF